MQNSLKLPLFAELCALGTVLRKMGFSNQVTFCDKGIFKVALVFCYAIQEMGKVNEKVYKE